MNQTSNVNKKITVPAYDSLTVRVKVSELGSITKIAVKGDDA